MSDRWPVVLIVAVLAVSGAVAVAKAGSRADRVHFDPNAAAVSATARIDGDHLSFDVRGAPARARVSATVHRLACARSGYGRAFAGSATADGSGRASWTSPLRLTGALRDGWHVVAIGAEGRTLACASIPASHPTVSRVPRHWGIWSFTRYFD